MPRLNVALSRIKKSVKRYPLRWGASVLLLLIVLYKEYGKKLLTDQSKKTNALENENAIQGSDQSNVQLDLGDPFNGLQQMQKLDLIWGPEIEAYRAIHDHIWVVRGRVQFDGSRRDKYFGSRRFPTRWAILRLTLEQQMKGKDIVGLSDPYDGAMKPDWVALLSTYSPTSEDIQNSANAVEQTYSRRDTSSSVFGDILGGLKDLVAGTAAAVSGNYGALAGIVKSKIAGSGTPDAFDVTRPLSKDEQVILEYLQNRIVDVPVDTPTTDRLRRMTAQEALSGGGVAILSGFYALGGPTDFAEKELRPLPLSPQAKALNNLGLSLKAALIARRVPQVSGSISEWPQRTAPGEIDYDSLGDL